MRRLTLRSTLALAFAVTQFARAAAPTLPGIAKAVGETIDKQEIAGAVTVVLGRDKLLHLEAHGMADLASKRPMSPDSIFWIASMSKPVTAAAVLLLQDEGKLNASDPVAKYLPEFKDLKTPSGKPANLTITHLLTHTSGLGESTREKTLAARSLADLVPVWLATPMQHEPGEKWKYNQAGINAAGRVVEVVSGMTFDQFLQKRVFGPLGMKDSGFYLDPDKRARLATGYAKNKDTGALEPAAARPEYDGSRERPPQGNGGLYSTPRDYARFAQMLLNGGKHEGRPFLSEAAMKLISSPQTGDLPTGFFQAHNTNYGWALGTCVLKQSHEGVAAMLSPGTFGHGGAWGTQAWIDPVKGVAYLLFVQRSNFPNADNSEVRLAFQEATAKALSTK